MVFMTADHEFDTALQKDMRKVIGMAGGKVIGNVKHPFNPRYFSSSLLTAQSWDPDVMTLMSAGLDMVNALKQATEFKLNEQKCVAPLFSS